MKYLRSQRGDSLIEVVIAMVILVSVLLSTYAVGTRMQRLGQTAKERQQLMAAMQQQAEYLRYARDKSDWDDFVNDYGAAASSWYLPDPNAAGNFTPAKRNASTGTGRKYRVNYTATCNTHVLPAPPDGIPDKCTFTIRGEWDVIQSASSGANANINKAVLVYTLVNKTYLKASR